MGSSWVSTLVGRIEMVEASPDCEVPAVLELTAGVPSLS